MLMSQNSLLYPAIDAQSDRLMHKCAQNYRIINDSHKDPKIDPLIQFRVGQRGLLITPLQQVFK